MPKKIPNSLDSADTSKKNDEMKNICTQVLELAKKKGATSAEVGLNHDKGLSLQVRDSAVETLEFNQDTSLGMTVYIGQAKGSASTTDLSDSAIESAVDAACNIARFTTSDPCAGLADAHRMANDLIDLALDHPTQVSIDECIDIAKTCETAGVNAHDHIRQSDRTALSSHRFVRVYANSHGFLGDVSSTRHSLSCSLIAEDQQGMQRDYWYTLNRQFDAMQSPQEVGIKAAERAVSRLSAKTLPTQRSPILFSPEIARGILGHFFAGIKGHALYRNASFLCDSKSDILFPEFVSMEEQPRLMGGLSSCCFDSEGVETQSRFIVENGVVKDYILDSYSARKLGLETTANAGGLHNVIMADTEDSFDDLLKKMDKGLLVTEVMGQGVNIVTGDYSRGAAGFWVENGAIQYPVHEITIAGALKDMFKGLVAVGNDRDERSSILTGSLLIEEMMIAGN